MFWFMGCVSSWEDWAFMLVDGCTLEACCLNNSLLEVLLALGWSRLLCVVPKFSSSDSEVLACFCWMLVVLLSGSFRLVWPRAKLLVRCLFGLFEVSDCSAVRVVVDVC